MVSCTASSLPILGKGLVERALRARRRRPMFMVDLAVPRDIEPEVGELDDVFLYTVDDLAQIVPENLDARRSAVEQAEAIIETQVGQFMRWMQARENVPLIRALREQGEQARRHELERALRCLQRGDDPTAVLEATVAGTDRQAAARARRRRSTRPPGTKARVLAEILSRAFPHQSEAFAALGSSTSLVGRLNDVNGLLASENATRDLDQYRKLSREHAELSTLVAPVRELSKGGARRRGGAGDGR